MSQLAETESPIVEVPFDGDTLAAIPHGSEVWIVVKRVCEALGITFQPQSTRLKSSPWSGVTMIVTPDLRGREQPALVIPLKRLSMWLATIDAGRVAEHARGKIERYQREAADALHAYFYGGTRNALTAVSHDYVTRADLESSMAAVIAPLIATMNTRLSVIETYCDNLAARISFAETHMAADGIVSRPRLRELRASVSNIARREFEAGRWKSKRAAIADVYRELREAVGWGGSRQPWHLLPVTLTHATFLALRRREAIARTFVPPQTTLRLA